MSILIHVKSSQRGIIILNVSFSLTNKSNISRNTRIIPSVHTSLPPSLSFPSISPFSFYPPYSSLAYLPLHVSPYYLQPPSPYLPTSLKHTDLPPSLFFPPPFLCSLLSTPSIHPLPFASLPISPINQLS